MTKKTWTSHDSSAYLILYRAVDEAGETGRAILFRSLAHLTGKPVAFIARQWSATNGR